MTVIGYSTGGLELSTTQGVVSRIEVFGYPQFTRGLRVQVDAALNPGNSGGPALVNDRVAGVAFSMNTEAENVGFLVPTLEVRRFLDDAADGTYDSRHRLHLECQTLDNPDLRDAVGIPDDAAGVLLRRSYFDEHAPLDDSQLEPGDILTHINGHAIDNRGLSRVAEDVRGSFLYHAVDAGDDGTIPITILRDGESMTVEEPAPRDWPLLLPYLGNDTPRYVIVGPMVFTQVTRDFFNLIGRDYQPVLGLVQSPLVERFFSLRDFEGEELVAVASDAAIRLRRAQLRVGHAEPAADDRRDGADSG